MVKQAYELPLVEGLFTLPNPPDKDPVAILKKLIERGMRQRGLTGKKEYEDRIEEELEVILSKDLSVYFVIVWDIMRFARQEGIAVGFARGSAGGSLICYVLQITEIDPLEYGLLFWRFLDKNRADTADIDLDFEDRRREDVKRYLAGKYGYDNVADIATYTYFSAKSAIKKAGALMRVPYSEMNTLVKGINEFDDFKQAQYEGFHRKYPEVYKVAKSLMGRLSGTAKHASGFIVADRAITDIAPVESRKIPNEEIRSPTIAYDKNVSEEVGFVKIDLLGIRNLTVVAECVKLVRERHGRIIDYKNLPKDDINVYNMLSDGHTVGVFQAEESASTNLIKKMKIHSFDDLVTSNALVRSGAWNAFGEEYLARKRGHKKVKYPTPESEEFLKDSYGLAVMQEQSMQICSIVAGMSEADANAVRRLTSKKKSKEELLPFKEKFISGCLANGVSERDTEKLWANIETTAEYQFNKCLAEDTMVEVKQLTEVGPYYETMTVRELFEKKAQRMYGDDIFYVKGPEKINKANVTGEAWHEVKAVHDNGEQAIMRIWLDADTYIDSTFMHRHRLSKAWKEAYRIHQGDKIWTDEGTKKVWKRSYEGIRHTYDVELYDEPHAFYANGFLTHNSHAVAYSKLSYVTAWLKFHYPVEFMTALLRFADSDSLSDYLSECKRLGIPVKMPDVNKSGITYTPHKDSIYIGLANIKYISDILAERIINMRPFESYEDMTERMLAKKSGLNTRVVASLNAVGATDFPDHKVDHEACKENYFEYLGIVSLDGANITEKMKEYIVPLEEYEEKTTAVVAGVVKDIVNKGWIRIDITDGTGKTGFFVQPDHGLQKGKMYIFALGNGSLLRAVDLTDYKSSDPLIRYLNGEMDKGTWIVAAKSRLTRNQKPMGDFLYSHNGRLGACKIFTDMMPVAKQFGPGAKVKIALNHSAKWGDSLKGIIRDE